MNPLGVVLSSFDMVIGVIPVDSPGGGAFHVLAHDGM